MKISISRIIAWSIEILGLLYIHQNYIADPTRYMLIFSIFSFCFCVWQVESVLQGYEKAKHEPSKSSKNHPIIFLALFIFVLVLGVAAFWGSYRAYLREDTIAALINITVGFVIVVCLWKSLKDKVN